MSTHLIVPDMQVRPDEPSNQVAWVGQYIRDRVAAIRRKYPEEEITIINLGDFADMPSMSNWDKGKIDFEGRRYHRDVEAVKAASEALFGPLFAEPDLWNSVKTVMLLGNHENRINRFVEKLPELHGFVSTDDLEYDVWYDEVYDFLEVFEADGVSYSHYFYLPNSGRPYGSQINTRLKDIGFSFTMGHQQGMLYGNRTLANGQTHHGLVAGSCYLQYEGYRGPQANKHWNGIVVKSNVKDGDYDAMFVRLDYLAERYAGHTLDEIKQDESLWETF